MRNICVFFDLFTTSESHYFLKFSQMSTHLRIYSTNCSLFFPCACSFPSWFVPLHGSSCKPFFPAPNLIILCALYSVVFRGAGNDIRLCHPFLFYQRQFFNYVCGDSTHHIVGTPTCIFYLEIFGALPRIMKYCRSTSTRRNKMITNNQPPGNFMGPDVMGISSMTTQNKNYPFCKSVLFLCQSIFLLLILHSTPFHLTLLYHSMLLSHQTLPTLIKGCHPL